MDETQRPDIILLPASLKIIAKSSIGDSAVPLPIRIVSATSSEVSKR